MEQKFKNATSPAVSVRFIPNFMIDMVVMGGYRWLLFGVNCEKLKKFNALWNFSYHRTIWGWIFQNAYTPPTAFIQSHPNLWGHSGYQGRLQAITFLGNFPICKNGMVLWTFINMGVRKFGKCIELLQTPELKESDMKSTLHMQIFRLWVPNCYSFCSTNGNFQDIAYGPALRKISNCHKFFKCGRFPKKHNRLYFPLITILAITFGWNLVKTVGGVTFWKSEHGKFQIWHEHDEKNIHYDIKSKNLHPFCSLRSAFLKILHNPQMFFFKFQSTTTFLKLGWSFKKL